MNNFPAMTEERRQKLIAECENEIAELTQSIQRCDAIGTADYLMHLQSQFLRQQVALAALTAKPVAYMYKDRLHSEPRFSSHTRFGNWSQEDINEYEITETKLYTAPPAPVLRVPDGWIKCSERYPEMGQEVLIRIPVCEKFNIENGKYEGDGRFLGAWFDTRGKGRPYKVTHWMPLPEPPEASNER